MSDAEEVINKDECSEERDDSLQGPHNWRKSLRPVKSRENLSDIRECGDDEQLYMGSESTTNDDNQGTTITTETTTTINDDEVDTRSTITTETTESQENTADKDMNKTTNEFRDKLKNMPNQKKELLEKKLKGPMVAKACALSASTSNLAVDCSVQNSKSPRVHRRRNSDVSNLESAFARQVVNGNPNAKHPYSPHITRKKQLTPVHVSRNITVNSGEKKAPTPMPVSPQLSGRRAQSPIVHHAADVVNLSQDMARRKVEKVMKARLYLLQQTGPNSFLVGGDSPNHKFRVIIGPQRCSCSRPHCVHLLFVMLRVFQVDESDACLWSKTLKNFEVEALLGDFHARRSSRIQDLKRKSKPRDNGDGEKSNKSSRASTPAEIAQTQSEKDEEEEDDDEVTCPICLLEMVEGESLTDCSGCQNKYHHHCIAVWFEMCRQEKDRLVCPLCRKDWKSDGDCFTPNTSDGGDQLQAPPNTRAASPQFSPQDGDFTLPSAEPIPPEHYELARPWVSILGEDLVACLFSKNWMIREIALKQLGKLATGALLLGVGEGRSGVMLSPTRQATTHSMLECCCNVLAYICADPVYKVFVAGLRTLRLVMSYTPCRDEAQQQRLQVLMKPVIDTILWKCADSNKRTSQLSISAMQELVKGQSGELAVGKEIFSPGSYSLGGVPYLIDCICQEFSQDGVQWQWLLGRFCMLEKLVDEHSTEFIVRRYVPHRQYSGSDEANSDGQLEECTSNQEMVLNILRFARKALGHSHTKVSKMARRVFYMVSRLQVHQEALMKEISDLLDDMEMNVQVHMKRKLLKQAEEYHVAQQVMGVVSGRGDPFPPCTTPEPEVSGSSTPRSGSPTPSAVSVMESLQVNFIPNVPPNSPAHRKVHALSKSVSTGTSLDFMPPLLRITSHDSSSDICESFTNAACSTPDQYLNLPQSKCNHCGQTLLHTPMRDACVCTSPIMKIRGLRPRTLHSRSLSSASEDFEFVEHLEVETDEDVLLNNSATSGEQVDAMLFTLEAAYDEHSANAEAELERIHEHPEEEYGAQYAEYGSGDELTAEEGSECATQTYIDGMSEAAEAVSLCSTEATLASSDGTVLTDDLSDLTDLTVLTSTNEDNVSFKTEVALSPNHASSGSETDASCHCKEEVELEEAKALASAMDASENQQALPFVPGLSYVSGEDTGTIKVQEENTDGGENVSDGQYLEKDHWVRGSMLGTGAFSTCYQARDINTGTLMAVKQISICRNTLSEQQKVSEAVEEEIQMMGKLNHPNIVRILGATKQGCHYFMFVEWMPGGSVSILLHQYGRFTEAVLMNYTQQVLRALAYLHDNHMLHRDLKGANLLIDSTGKRLRIGDFGASARLASRQTGAGEFQGQLLGTIAFMAPEVLRGESYGRSCDVWSVGCTMIEMCTTKPPWGAHDMSNHLALIFKIASTTNPPPIPDNLSPALRDLMLRCLECNREDRPPAKELLKHPLFTMFTGNKC